MLNAIVRFSIRFRGMAISLACALLGYGIFSLTNMPYDVFPEFAPPQVSIQTEAPGLSPEQVGDMVTQQSPNVINGPRGLATLRASSIEGLSIITVTCEPGSDTCRDRQLDHGRLAEPCSQLPVLL